MGINDLTIGQARELAKLFGPSGENFRLFPQGRRCIAVLQRGNVVAGVYSQSGQIATISDAAVVRRWGTTKGLGELAASGPQPSTILDPCQPVSFHVREAVFVMEVNEDAWRK